MLTELSKILIVFLVCLGLPQPHAENGSQTHATRTMSWNLSELTGQRRAPRPPGPTASEWGPLSQALPHFLLCPPGDALGCAGRGPPGTNRTGQVTLWLPARAECWGSHPLRLHNTQPSPRPHLPPCSRHPRLPIPRLPPDGQASAVGPTLFSLPWVPPGSLTSRRPQRLLWPRHRSPCRGRGEPTPRAAPLEAHCPFQEQGPAVPGGSRDHRYQGR